MKDNAQTIQRSLFVVGVLSAGCTHLTFGSAITSWLIGTSALCFLVLPFAVFFRPKSAWMSGLIGGGIVLLTYAFSMPFWGRLWYHGDEPEDWRVFVLFIIIGLNLVMPAIRGFSSKK